MISVEKIETLQDLDDLRSVWDQLLAKSDFRNIFLTFDWPRTWWKVFGDDKELYVLLVKSGAEIIGIAPLMREKAKKLGRTVKIIRFIGTPNIDYADFIGENKRLIVEHVTGYLFRNREDWFRVELDQISERSSTLSHLQACLRTSKRPFTTREIETCFAYIYEGKENDRTDFSIRKRKAIRHAINSFKKAGGLNIEIIGDFIKAKQNLAIIFQLHINRWEATPTPSKFLNPKHRQFHEDLLDKLWSQNNILLVVLRTANLPIAYWFNFEYGSIIYHHTMAFNKYLSRRSPGKLLAILASELFVRQGFDLDFSRGATDYKVSLANRTYHNFQTTMYGQRLDYISATVIESIKKRKVIRAILRNQRIQYCKLKITGILQEKGLRVLIRRFLEYVLMRIMEYKVFYVFRHDGRHETIPSPGIEVEIKMLGIEDVDQIATFYGVREDSDKHKTMIQRFEEKADCFAAFHNGNIVYVSWTLFGEDYWSDYKLLIKAKDNEVIFSDALASPIYRGMGLYTHVLAYKLNKYSREGYRALSVVEKSNTAALKATAKFGFKRLPTYQKLKLFSRWVL